MKDFKITTTLYQNENTYNGQPFELEALIDGKEFQTVGQVDEKGQLTINLPADMPHQVLTERAPGLLGGTLTLKPNIMAQKEGHPLYIVYVNQDAGPYKAGWSYANDQHQPITAQEAATYQWIVNDN